jgi:two-component system, LytTR family, response regulator
LTTIRTLIVDDEPAAREAIRELLRSDPEISVVGECRNGRDAVARLRAGGIDLVFLDVQMPEVDGLAVAEQLRGREMPAIVFVTAFDRYALRAFDLHAVDYLLKPFTDERFLDTVRHVKRVIGRGETQELAARLARLLDDPNRPAARAPEYLSRIPVHVQDRVLLLPVGEIDWIGADGDYVRLHAGKSEYMIRDSLTRLGATLDPARFARIHRSTIVNLDRVRELRPLFKGDHTVRLHDGTQLKLSRHFKESLERLLGREL